MEAKPNSPLKLPLKAPWIPNILSGIRIIFAILFPLVNSNYWLALLTLALLTEFFDGTLARKFNWASPSGQILDPIADRLFALSVGITLVFAHKILPSQLLFVMFRDVVVSLGLITALLFLNTSAIVAIFKPNFAGKAATGLQYLFYYDIVVFLRPHNEVLWLAGLTSVASAIMYSIKFFFYIRLAHWKF